MGYIYKPNTRKGPVFLSPSAGSGPPQIKLADGRVITAVKGDQAGGVFQGHEGFQYVFPRDVLGQQGATLMFNGQSQSLGDSNMSYRGDQFGSLQESEKGSMSDMTSTMQSAFGGAGGLPNALAMMFNAINYKPIKYKPIKTAPYNFVDPIQAATKYNAYNAKAEGEAYNLGKLRSGELFDLDTAATEQFAGRMSGLQQNLVAGENAFNQAQRLQAVDFAMPDLRSSLDAKKGRADTYASGRLLSSAEDRAYQVAAQSASADGSFVRGFGDDSVFGKRTSDILSAEQRLGISQMGEGMLNDWVSQGSQLLIDTPLKSSISQQLRGTPGILPSQLAGQQQNMLTNLTTIPLQFGISSEINQEQYKTNSENRTREFNAGNILAKDEFNASNEMSKDMFNSSGAFAASQAQFQGLTSNYQLATQAANRAQDIQRQDSQSEAAAVAGQQNIAAQQSAGNTSAAAQIGGAIISAAPAIIGALTGGSSADPATPQPIGATRIPGNSGATSVAPTGSQSFDVVGGSAPESSGGPSVGSSGGSSVDSAPSNFNDVNFQDPNAGQDFSVSAASGPLTRSGAPTTYQGGAIPVSSSDYDVGATASQVSQAVQDTGQLLQNVGFSGPSTPQVSALGSSMANGARAAEQITTQFQSANTPEAQMALADSLKGAALTNASSPESQASVEQIFSQVMEHIDTGVGVNGQAAGVAGFVKNYNSYNDAEKVRGITNISFAGQDLEGEFGVKDLTSASLAKIPVAGTNNKMNMQDAVSLQNAGYNVSGLVKNWDDIEEVHSILGGNGTLLSVASTGRDLDLIGGDTPQVISQKQAALKTIGANPSGAWGAGAVAVPAVNQGQAEKQGFIPVGKTTDGQAVLVPIALAASAGLSQGVVGSGMSAEGLKQMAPKTLAVGQRAANTYENWSTDFIPKSTSRMGESSSVAAGLYKLGEKDPYKLGNVILGNIQKNKSVTPQAQNIPSVQDTANLSRDALTVYNGWDTLDAGGKALSVAKLGMSGYKFGTGDDLSKKYVVDPSGDNKGLTVGDAYNLAAQGYNIYKLAQNWNKLSTTQQAASGAGTAASLAQLGTQQGLWDVGDIGGPVAIATAAYNAYNILGSNASDKDKASAIRHTAQDTAAAYFTAGLSSLAQGIDRQFLGGKTDKLRNTFEKFDPVSRIENKVLEKGLGALDSFGGKNKDQQNRDELRSVVQDSGMVDQDFNLTLADGTKFNIGDDGKRDREWFDKSQRRPDQQDVNELGAYDVDYTRDIDAVTNVGGHALAALQFGSYSDKAASDMGNYYTNAFVSNSKSDKLTMDNFTTTQSNLQKGFMDAGIETKDEAYALSNQMKAEGRVTDVELVSIQQGINLAFDKNAFQGANQLLEGVKLGRKGESAPGVKEQQFAGKPIMSAEPKPISKVPTIKGPDVDKFNSPILNNPMQLQVQDQTKPMEIQTV